MGLFIKITTVIELLGEMQAALLREEDSRMRPFAKEVDIRKADFIQQKMWITRDVVTRSLSDLLSDTNKGGVMLALESVNMQPSWKQEMRKIGKCMISFVCYEETEGKKTLILKQILALFDMRKRMGTTLKGENKELFSKSSFQVRQWFERALAQEGKSKTHNRPNARGKGGRGSRDTRQKVEFLAIRIERSFQKFFKNKPFKKKGKKGRKRARVNETSLAAKIKRMLGMGGPIGATERPTQDELAKKHAELVCHKCHQKGHVKRNCTQ